MLAGVESPLLMQFPDRQFPVRIKYPEGFQVFQQNSVFVHVMEDLGYNIPGLWFDVVINKLVYLTGRNQVGVLEVAQVPGSFGLGKVKDMFQICDTHFFFHVQQEKDSDPCLIRKGFEKFQAEGQAKVFYAHVSNFRLSIALFDCSLLQNKDTGRVFSASELLILIFCDYFSKTIVEHTN